MTTGPPATRDDDPGGRRPLRVLFFDHTATLGGGEIALLHLATNLDPARVRPIVLLGADGDLNRRLEETGVETHVLSLGSEVMNTRKDSLGLSSAARLGAMGRMAGYVLRLARFMRAGRFDIVHTNSLKSDVLGGIAARLAGLPVIWHIRDRIAEDYLPRPAVRAFRLLCRTIPTAVIANSAATLETVMLPPGRIAAVAYSGRFHLAELAAMARADADGGQGASAAASDADPGPSACSPPDAAVSGGVGLDAGASGADADARPQRRIGLVGRISPWKGQDVFIRAARQVRLRCPDTEFLIIGSAMFGETQYEQELHRLVVECGLQSCTRFLGFRHDIDAVIHSLDVLVHASTAPEPFGQVVVDGMAAGTPVVATRGGGVTEIVDDGVTGLLVTMGSADEMAEAIVATLCDPARAAERAAAARRAVMDRFTIEATVASVQSVYDRLAPQGRRA